MAQAKAPQPHGQHLGLRAGELVNLQPLLGLQVGRQVGKRSMINEDD
jgi:hypothetical protein